MNSYNSTLLTLLHNRAVKQPEKIAYKFLIDGEAEEVSLTYQKLDQQARAIASSLQDISATGERILLLYPPGLEFITAFLGCLYAGAIAVPVYPPRRNQRIQRLQAITTDAQASIALTTASLLSNIEQHLAIESKFAALKCLATDKIAVSLAERWQPPTLEASSLAFLQYTSGSTGIPKGVMVTHGNLLHNSEYIKQSFELNRDSVSVTWLPSSHDMGLIDGIIQPLYTGFLQVIMPPSAFVQRPIRWLSAISLFKATHCGCPNFGYELCVHKISPEQLEMLDLSRWLSAYNGAEPIRRETLERFAEKFKPCGFRANFFYPCYGMAETTLMVWVRLF